MVKQFVICRYCKKNFATNVNCFKDTGYVSEIISIHGTHCLPMVILQLLFYMFRLYTLNYFHLGPKCVCLHLSYPYFILIGLQLFHFLYSKLSLCFYDMVIGRCIFTCCLIMFSLAVCSAHIIKDYTQSLHNIDAVRLIEKLIIR